MPSVAHLVGLAQEALILSVAVSLPVVAAAALVGLVVALLQTATGIGDVSVGHLPRLLAVAAVLAVGGSWMGGEVAAFATRVLSGG